LLNHPASLQSVGLYIGAVLQWSESTQGRAWVY